MRIFDAILWSFLLTLLAGAALEGTAWLILDSLHTPYLIQNGIEVLLLLPLGILFVWGYKNMMESDDEGFEPDD